MNNNPIELWHSTMLFMQVQKGYKVYLDESKQNIILCYRSCLGKIYNTKLPINKIKKILILGKQIKF